MWGSDPEISHVADKLLIWEIIYDNSTSSNRYNRREVGRLVSLDIDYRKQEENTYHVVWITISKGITSGEKEIKVKPWVHHKVITVQEI